MTARAVAYHEGRIDITYDARKALNAVYAEPRHAAGLCLLRD
jgi:hypothetical protein